MSTPPAGEPFASLDELRRQHQQMLERQAGSETVPPQTIPADEIAGFLGAAGATGALLADPEDRRAVQRILDYWSADLIAASRRERVEVRPVQLAPHAADAPEPEDAIRNPEEARQYIRLSALARQWRDSGAAGYLLGGEALDEAERFARDPDIAALIAESRRAQGRTQRRRQRLKNVALAVLVAVIALLGFMYWQTDLARQAAEEASAREAAARQAAEADREAAREAEAQATMQAERANAERLRAEESARQATRQWREQTSRNAELDAALDVLTRQVASGLLDPGSVTDYGLRSILMTRLAPADTPDPLSPYAMPPGPQAATADAATAQWDTPTDLPTAHWDAPADTPAAQLDALTDMPTTHRDAAIGFDRTPFPGVDAAPIPAEPSLAFTGYDPIFVGWELPLPTLPEAQAATAWQGGEPLPYFYYSIILDAERRLAILSAANLDRPQSRALPRAVDAFRPDPRLPLGAQPDPATFETREIEPGRLVDRADISWGPALPADTAEAAVFVAQMTSHYPNLVPQVSAVAQQAWQAVGDWVRLQHNPAAARVAIFSGPVFSQNGLPDAYWKVAVSTTAEGMLTADAFLVPNSSAATQDIEAHRTGVEEIARLTGLGFPDALIAAAGPGRRLAARVPDLDAPDGTVRRAVVQELADLLRDPEAEEADRLQVVDALLTLGEDRTLAYLSPEGRVNLLFVLAQVPKADWMREVWLPLTARARRLAATDARMGPEAREQLGALREVLDLADPPDQTVYLQFAGFTADEAEAIRRDLQTLGWDMPGAERVEAAQGLDQVRYRAESQDDEAAARLLAADLWASGHPEVRAVGMEIIKPGVLEIWLSTPEEVLSPARIRRPAPAPRD